MTLIKHNITKQLHQMMRWEIIEKGIIASSPMRRSQNRKTMSIPPEPQKSPMTVALFQGNSPPPYCSASKHMIEVGAKNAKPMKSSFGQTVRITDVNFSFGNLVGEVTEDQEGGGKTAKREIDVEA
jgi:hypothetical protein